MRRIIRYYRALSASISRYLSLEDAGICAGIMPEYPVVCPYSPLHRHRQTGKAAHVGEGITASSRRIHTVYRVRLADRGK